MTAQPTVVKATAAEPDARDDAVDLLEEITRLRGEVANLREAMRTRAPIEQAKGMLMLAYGMDGEAAFEQLAWWSQHWHAKLALVAQTMVDTSAVPAVSRVVSPPASLRRTLRVKQPSDLLR